MTRAHDNRSSYRCAIAPEDSAAKIKIGGRLHDCAVTSTSRDGFSARVANRLASRLQRAAEIQLWFRGEKWEVSVVSQFCEDAESTTFGLNRVRELTKIKNPSSWGVSLVPRFSANTDPSFVLALLVAFLAICICLPGVGTSLGTAPKIKAGVDTILKRVTDTFH